MVGAGVETAWLLKDSRDTAEEEGNGQSRVNHPGP